MKQSIVVVLLAALVCSITQPGFAADFTLRFQGLEIKNLSRDVARVELLCDLQDSTGGTMINGVKAFLPALDSSGKYNVISGPFDFEIGRNFAHRESIRRWNCFLKIRATSSDIRAAVACPSATPPPGVQAFQCVDPQHFNRLQASGTITP